MSSDHAFDTNTGEASEAEKVASHLASLEAELGFVNQAAEPDADRVAAIEAEIARVKGASTEPAAEPEPEPEATEPADELPPPPAK